MRRLLCIALLAACSDGGSDKPIDAPPGGADAYPLSCLIQGIYGDLGAKTGTTAQGPTTATIVLDAGPPRDSFFLKLTSGMGVFAGGLQTGTFQLAGAELSTTTCGVCVNIIADIVTGQGPSKFYFATAGSVTLTSHTPPVGSLSNVTMREVTAGGVPVGSTCTASITSMMFSAQ